MKRILAFSDFSLDSVNEASTETPLDTTKLESGLEIIKGLVTRGFTPKTAAAIAGNMWQESKFNPQVTPKTATYIGLIQWGGPRKGKLLQKTGWDKLDTQLDFVKHEFDTIPVFKNILPSIENIDVKQAASKIAKSYEGAAPNTARLNAAKQLLDAYEADPNAAAAEPK